MHFFIGGIAYPKPVSGNRAIEAEKWSKKLVENTINFRKVDGPCSLKVVFYLPPDRFEIGSPYGTDIDNLVKRLLDALNETVLSDVPGKDGCIMNIEAEKSVALKPSQLGVDIKINGQIEAPSADRFLYFAYGSNMHKAWLESRVGDPIKVCNAYLPKFRLRVNKVSRDKYGMSGKANIEPSGFETDGVWGVLWSIDNAKLADLDEAEWCKFNTCDSHYKHQRCVVFGIDGIPFKALTYIACEGKAINDDIPMFKWYHLLLTKGAEGNGLPMDHQELIKGFLSKEDPDSDRHHEKMDIVKRWPVPE